MNQKYNFAVLLPLTSRNCEQDKIYKNLKIFLTSLTNDHSYSSCSLTLYIGIDYDDIFYSTTALQTYSAPDESVPTCKMNSPGLQFVRDWVGKNSPQLNIKVFVFPKETKGKICHIWRKLARKGWEDKCDFFVLFGDDIEIHTSGWAEKIIQEFKSLHNNIQTNLPFGFGCISIYDNAYPYFPTFPVVHKLHMDIFGGEIFPSLFINQDADPYIFELYKRWSSAKFSSDVKLTNNIGGYESYPSRYERKHVDWAHETLKRGIDTINEYFRLHTLKPNFSSVVMDVVIPSYRCKLEQLKLITKIKAPIDVVTTFIIVIDHPNPKSEAVTNIKTYYEQFPITQYQLLINDKNKGPSETRTRGYYHSFADWILFLDDDVIPSDNLLSTYANSIRLNPDAKGFIGRTIIPEPNPEDFFCVAAKMIDIFYWWDISLYEKYPSWGVTANLVARRIPNFGFDPTFKCGEDIDFCLRLKEKGPLISAPDAVAIHPWWKENKTDYAHFLFWARGDGRLLDVHKKHTYRTYPDGVETMILSILIFIISIWFKSFPCMICSLSTFLIIWIIEGIIFFHSNYSNNRYNFNQKSIVQKMKITWHAILIQFASQYGRIRGHWDRIGIKFPKHFGRRFDWSGGAQKDFIQKMKKEATIRFIFYMFPLVIYVLKFSYLI